MEKKELISVILPVYNVEDYIDECIKSIVGQDYSNLEIILIDDGSTDTSGYLCDKWALIDNRIKVFHNNNHGVSYARNYGKSRASGAWITFVDPDDWIEDGLYSRAMKRISEDDSIDILFWDYSRYEKDEKKVPNHFVNTTIDFFSEEMSNLQCEVLKNDCSKPQSYYALRSPVTEIIKRNLAQKFDFPESIFMGEDTCYIMQCIGGANHIQYMNFSGYVYRIQNRSAVHSFQKRRGIRTEELSLWLMNYAYDSGNEKLIISSYKNHVINMIAMLNYYVDFNISGKISNDECENYIVQLSSSKYSEVVRENIKKIKLTVKEKLFLDMIWKKRWKLLKEYKKVKNLL